MPSADNTILVNEIFGPTFQGEGPDMGRPCWFIRLQGCPVQCPGCDTAYTWNGSERGTLWTVDEISGYLRPRFNTYRGCGLVVSGGEPLIHTNNTAWIKALWYKFHVTAKWQTVETSGYPAKDPAAVKKYLLLFDRVIWSPKITPCLRGKPSDKDILEFANIIKHEPTLRQRTHVKVVVRDEADLDAVLQNAKQLRNATDAPIHLMPYGIEREEVLAGCKLLLEWCAWYGFTLSPRLHSILWGSERGV